MLDRLQKLFGAKTQSTAFKGTLFDQVAYEGFKAAQDAGHQRFIVAVYSDNHKSNCPVEGVVLTSCDKATTAMSHVKKEARGSRFVELNTLRPFESQWVSMDGKNDLFNQSMVGKLHVETTNDYVLDTRDKGVEDNYSAPATTIHKAAWHRLYEQLHELPEKPTQDGIKQFIESQLDLDPA